MYEKQSDTYNKMVILNFLIVRVRKLDLVQVQNPSYKKQNIAK